MATTTTSTSMDTTPDVTVVPVHDPALLYDSKLKLKARIRFLASSFNNSF